MTDVDRHSPAFRIGLTTSLIPLGFFCALVYLLPQVATGKVFYFQIDWVPSLDIHLSVLIDGLSLLFALVICCVGFFVVLYAAVYLGDHPHSGRFYFYLHGFMLAMLGLVLVENLMALFVFWELTTLFSYLLIGFEHGADTARANARQALLVTGAGGLALLIGILLLETICDTYALTGISQHIDQIQQHPLYHPILILVFIGAFTKSAQFPFHFWLPNAMSAPTPISAFLHSATMVKAGIYLLARLHPILGSTPAWMATLVIVGGITALIGSVQAMTQSDLKRILAFTTIMALGILTMFLGGKTAPALTAAMTFFLVHSLYKSSLFLVVGIIDHQTGTRRLEHLGGLLKPMPMTAFAAVTAALSMAGFPLFFGFIGKEIMYEGALSEDMFPEFATVAAVLSNSLMTAVAGIITIRLFLGPLKKTPRISKEPPWYMWIGPVFLGSLGIVFGIVPHLVAYWLIEPAVRAFHWTTEDIQLRLFHGISDPLLLSIITLGLGTTFYILRRQIRQALERFFDRLPYTAEHGYTCFLNAIARLAAIQTRILQNGSLHRYLVVIIGSATLGIGVPFVQYPPPFGRPEFSGVGLPVWLVVFIIAAAVILVVSARSRLLAICGLGVVGVGIAMLFLISGAPDLALTQLLVETLTVIIASLVLLRLPRLDHQRPGNGFGKMLNGVLAVAAGAVFTALILAVTHRELDRYVTDFFEANSYIAAHGRNIVNVILVDFRSLDTLGEITVVALAGLAGYALIRTPKAK
jgi:multicomponent Na+:H+ antiporter subunit A